MKAMILAAGLGTRLRPLTDDRPKALVEVAGRTLLEIALKRLDAIGVRDVIINIHHYADMILDYVKSHDNFGMRIEFSREEILLDTGGGLKRAANFFLRDGASSEEPFILHNVDVISTIDLGHMVRFHVDHDALATLAVQNRETSRYLLFDEHGELCGRRAVHNENPERNEPEMARPAGQVLPLAFSGIHVISPRVFSGMEENGAFSIITTYLHLAAQGARIIAFRADNSYWRDLGRPEHIAQAAQDLRFGVLWNLI
jgi:NDP-sugar pyrophosphorylase family protein